ncbi:MAG TPA: SlyX family protein [Planctomycetota bacterium]
MTDADRIAELETSLAFQEREIIKLRAAILEQQKQLERVAALCEALRQKAREGPGEDLPHEKPPHSQFPNVKE